MLPLIQSPSTMSLEAVGDRLNRSVAQANVPSANACCRSRTASQMGLVHDVSPGPGWDTRTSRPGSRTGSGFSARLLRIEKSAVTPPIPSASETTANAVRRGAARSDRDASRQSIVNMPRMVKPPRRSAKPKRHASKTVVIQKSTRA